MNPNESPSRFIYTRASLTPMTNNNNHPCHGLPEQLSSAPLTDPPHPYANFWPPGQASSGHIPNRHREDTVMGDPYTAFQPQCTTTPFPQWPAAANQPTHGLSYDGRSEGLKQSPAVPHPLCLPLINHNDPYQPQVLNIGIGDHGNRRCGRSPLNSSSDTATIVPSEGARGDDGRSSISSSAFSLNNSPASEIHTICLLATQTYLRERRTNWRLRGSHRDSSRQPYSSSSSPRASRWTPYVTPSSDRDRRRSLTGEKPTCSLLENVSRISTSVWKQAMRNRMYVPNSERMALENMGQLLGWAETVMEGGRDEERETRRVLTAGRNLCAWLGDEVGMEMIVALE